MSENRPNSGSPGLGRDVEPDEPSSTALVSQPVTFSGPRLFRLYRVNPPAEYREGGYANAPDDPQLEGVIFSDGSVAIRWLTPLRSMSYWRDFETFEAVHGHPEYESRIDFGPRWWISNGVEP